MLYKIGLRTNISYLILFVCLVLASPIGAVESRAKNLEITLIGSGLNWPVPDYRTGSKTLNIVIANNSKDVQTIPFYLPPFVDGNVSLRLTEQSGKMFVLNRVGCHNIQEQQTLHLQPQEVIVEQIDLADGSWLLPRLENPPEPDTAEQRNVKMSAIFKYRNTTFESPPIEVKLYSAPEKFITTYYSPEHNIDTEQEYKRQLVKIEQKEKEIADIAKVAHKNYKQDDSALIAEYDTRPLPQEENGLQIRLVKSFTYSEPSNQLDSLKNYSLAVILTNVSAQPLNLIEGSYESLDLIFEFKDNNEKSVFKRPPTVCCEKTVRYSRELLPGQSCLRVFPETISKESFKNLKEVRAIFKYPSAQDFITKGDASWKGRIATAFHKIDDETSKNSDAFWSDKLRQWWNLHRSGTSLAMPLEAFPEKGSMWHSYTYTDLAYTRRGKAKLIEAANLAQSLSKSAEATSLNNAGNACIYMDETKEAESFYKKALSVIDSPATCASPQLKARILHNLIVTENIVGEKKVSDQYSQKLNSLELQFYFGKNNQLNWISGQLGGGWLSDITAGEK